MIAHARTHMAIFARARILRFSGFTMARFCCQCGTRILCSDSNCRRWRAALCAKHWRWRLAHANAQHAPALQKKRAQFQWMGKEPVKAGRMDLQRARTIYICKAGPAAHHSTVQYSIV